MTAPTTVDEYLAALPDEARAVLAEVRAAVLRGMPTAVAASSLLRGVPASTTAR